MIYSMVSFFHQTSVGGGIWCNESIIPMNIFLWFR